MARSAAGATVEEPLGEAAREGPEPDTLRSAYQSISDCHKELAEFRGKLLALLPVATGTGVFLLLTEKSSPEYIAVGALGALFTVGLLIFERRGVTMCKNIAETGVALEREMKLGHARFKDCPDPKVRKTGREWVEVAGWVVYLAVLVAWLVVMTFGLVAAI